ncbi:hypothetical protein PLESTM_002099600, partial [Pleodorina starrii]
MHTFGLEGLWLGLNTFLFGLTVGWIGFSGVLHREASVCDGNQKKRQSVIDQKLHGVGGPHHYDHHYEPLLVRLVCMRTLGFAIQSFHLLAVYRLWEGSGHSGRHPLSGHWVALTGLLVPLAKHVVLQGLALAAPRAYMQHRQQLHLGAMLARLVGLMMQAAAAGPAVCLRPRGFGEPPRPGGGSGAAAPGVGVE